MSAEVPKGLKLKIRDQDKRANVINSVITAQNASDILQELQGPAPSGTEYFTRTPVIEGLLKGLGVPLGTFETNFARSGSPAILLDVPKKLWVAAHSDTVSYLTPRPTNETTVDLMPLAAHRPEEAHEWPAAVLRYSPKHRIYEVVSIGAIGSEGDHEMRPYYVADTKPKDGFVPGLDRFVFAPNMQVDPESGLMQGNVDNAAGIAVSILVLEALAEVASQKWSSHNFADFPVGFVFPGQEEGLAEQSAFFSRGARQMIHNFTGALPRTIIEVDGQDIDEGNPIPNEALLAAYVSKGKGAIVAPHTYDQYLRFLRELAPYGTDVRMSEEVSAVVSRSNDVAWMERVKGVVPLGYGCRWPHFNKGMPETNINALVNNAKAIAWIATSMKA